jgi:hypothetical protein
MPLRTDYATGSEQLWKPGTTPDLGGEGQTNRPTPLVTQEEPERALPQRDAYRLTARTITRPTVRPGTAIRELAAVTFF